ncbi:MAG: hypothetical protein RIR70_770 [Pseudomonadota bacterium]|jgi:Flp pilus assembly protein TadD
MGGVDLKTTPGLPSQGNAMPDDLSKQARDLHLAGQLHEAEACYRALVERDGPKATTLNDLGNLLVSLQRREDAEHCYRHALTLAPDFFEAHNNLGNLLRARGQFKEAEAHFRHALRAAPDHPDICNNLAVLLGETHRIGEAEQIFLAVLHRHPDQLEALNNLGNLLKDTGRLAHAEAVYRRLLAKHPDHPDARWNMSLLWLLRGEYEKAWPYFESRFDPRRAEQRSLYPALPSPRWQGGSLQGKTLLIWPEQGMGDEIQMARFVSVVRKRFQPARIVLGCKAALQAVLCTTPGIDAITRADAPPPPHDTWCFSGSLPYLCQATWTNLPNRLPYLGPLPERLAQWGPALQSIGGQDTLRVGLVWAGNRLHKNDAYRSLPSLALLAPLWQVPGIAFVSLQHGAPDDPAVREALAPPPHQPLVHLGSALRDFGDTAAIVAGLDLVICVDTAIAHLAGALGKPCWVLLPHRGLDWRWGTQGQNSPWYAFVIRLFRQGPDGNWPTVIDALASALSQWRAEKRRYRPLLSALSEEDIKIISAAIDATQGSAPANESR